MPAPASEKQKPSIIVYTTPCAAAHKLHAYLTLRQLPYRTVPQPASPPRDDLRSLGLNASHVPVLALGCSLFPDASMALAELERKFPDGGLGLGEEQGQGKGESDGGGDGSLLRQAREVFSGRTGQADQKALEKLEREVLRNEGGWIGSGNGKGKEKVEGPTLVDVEVLAPLALQDRGPSVRTGPRLTQLVSRFREAVARADPHGQQNQVSPEEAKETILAQYKPLASGAAMDPTEKTAGVKLGEEVEVWPLAPEHGERMAQRGRVRGLDKHKIVLEVVPTMEPNGGRAVYAVMPREGWEVRSLSAKGAARL